MDTPKYGETLKFKYIKYQLILVVRTKGLKKFKTEPCVQVSYSVEKYYVDDSKSILAETKGEDIDITSDSDNDKDELEIL